MKVVSPASVSRLSDVSHCLNLKKRSNALPEPLSTASMETWSSLRSGVGSTGESVSHGAGLRALTVRWTGLCRPTEALRRAQR